MKVLVGRILRPFTITMGVLALFTGITPPVFAADKGALEEIVVTARYREEKLQDTPIAITALSAQDLQVRGFTDAYQIGYTVPNASFRPAQAAFGNTMSAYIRGIGQYDFLPEFEPGVAIYLDDVLYPVTMGSMVDLMDLERVEVLRGPQGTLFGRGAIGGAIRYVSKKPEGDNTGYIQVTGGAYDRVDVRAGYDFALTKNLYGRVTGVSKRRDGYQKVYDFACLHPNAAGTLPKQIVNRSAGCQLGTQGGENVAGARGSLRWVANNDLEFNVNADYINDNSEARADKVLVLATDASGQLPVPFNFWSAGQQATWGVPFDSRFIPKSPYISYATYSDPNLGLSFKPTTSVRQWGVSGTGDWKINDQVSAKVILSYRKFHSQFATDTDQSPLDLQLVDGRQAFHSFSAEFRLSGRFMDRLDWTVGFFHLDDRFRSGQTVVIPAFYGGGPLVNGLNITDATNNSGFATGVYDITDRWSFTGGVRYSEDKKTDDFDNTIVTTTLSTKNTHFDWKVGSDYKVTDDVMVYGSIATGYRPQAFNPRPFQVTQFVQVDAEEATSYELGIKGDFLDRRLRTNLAGFYIDYGKRIVPVGGTECLLIPGTTTYNTVPAGTPGAITDSLGNTCLSVTSRTFYQNTPGTIYGVELEATARPTDGLTLQGIFGYTHWKSSDINDNPLVVVDLPIYVPELNWNVSASYEFNVVDGATVTPRVDVYGQSKICSSTTNTNGCEPAYELVNARIEYATANRTWTAAFGVTNLANKKYNLNRFDLTAFGQPTTEGQPAHPREWYVTVRRNFD